MLKAVLFDMDGLIFDTESIYKQSWQYAATEQGLTITDDFYQQFIGVQTLNVREYSLSIFTMLSICHAIKPCEMNTSIT